MSDRQTNSPSPERGAILRIIAGPAAGKEFTLQESSYVLGRSGSVDVPIPDNLLSRSHARIFLRNDAWMVEDLDSTNGTWIKGKRLSEPAELPLRTTFSIGSSLLEVVRPNAKPIGDGLDEELISCRVRPVNMERLVKEAAHGRVRREQKHLAAIYKFQQLLSAPLEEFELYNKILEIVTEVVPGDAAYLMKFVPDDDRLVPVAERNADGRVEEVTDTYISRSVTRYVKERKEGILSVDARTDDRFHGESLCGFNMHSVMCVPMLGRKELCGIIYLVSMQAAKLYDGNDLKLLTSIAQSAGLAIENSRLLEANIRAERMAAIGTTAASLSHYVKNILTGLEGSVSLLRVGIDDSDNDLMNEAWEILSKYHKHLSSLVLDLLNLAKEDVVEFGIYNLSDIVQETVELARTQAREQNVQIDFEDGTKGAPVLAEIDSRGIHRVLLNLINNAMDAVVDRHEESGGGRIRVAYRLTNRGNVVVIEVADNGVGIPAEKLDKVFEMFHTSKGARGTGLGLAVSKRIIDSHRGVIVVGSEVNVGTHFTVKFPVRQQATNTDFIQRPSATPFET